MRSEYDQNLASATARYNAQEDEQTIYNGTEIIARMRAAGKTHVDTYGGAMPLDEWAPYAHNPADTTWIVNADGSVTDAAILTARAGEYFGRWTFSEYSGPAATGAHADNMDYSEQAAQDQEWTIRDR